VSGLLGWDEQVQMPPGAAELRSQQQQVLAGVLFEKETAPELGALLQKLAASPPEGVWEKAVVRDATRDYKRKTALTKELAQREARLSSEGYQAWVKARSSSDFSAFSPVLGEWLALVRERSAAIDPSQSAYNVSLDGFERGMTTSRLDEIFTEVRNGLIPLLAQVKASGTAPDASWLSGDWDVKKQAELCSAIAVEMGFDLNRGRLDVSVHPFTGGAGPSDVRMTTRFKAHDMTEGLTGAVHETGHALYEQGRPGGEVEGLPASSALSMGVHESQSLLWERCVALSRPFAEYLLPKLRATFPGQIPDDKTPEDLYRALNVVSTRSLIRVESDELSYPLHVILRYELETALLAGTISVEELPAAWNAKMKEYLGVEPENDAQGVLQDVHWSAGAIGYFPSYSLGAMMAVQLFDSARTDLPTLDADISAGRFAPLREWLRAKVHCKGSLLPTADELMVSATGSPLKPAIYLNFMRAKYSDIYALST
jgi:carboxypeptidase Taq